MEEEVQNQQPLQEEKSYKKFIIIGIIVGVVIILIVAGYFIVTKMIEDNKKELNIAVLKNMKCLTTCPYTENLISFECKKACQDKYTTLYFEGDQIKYDDELFFFNMPFSFRECFEDEIESNQDEFNQCINDALEEHSHIIDLSNVDVSVDY